MKMLSLDLNSTINQVCFLKIDYQNGYRIPDWIQIFVRMDTMNFIFCKIVFSWRPAVARKRTPNVVIDRSSGMLVDDGDSIEFPSPTDRIDPSSSPEYPRLLKESSATFQLLEHVLIQHKDGTTTESTRNMNFIFGKLTNLKKHEFQFLQAKKPQKT